MGTTQYLFRRRVLRGHRAFHDFQVATRNSPGGLAFAFCRSATVPFLILFYARPSSAIVCSKGAHTEEVNACLKRRAFHCCVDWPDIGRYRDSLAAEIGCQ